LRCIDIANDLGTDLIVLWLAREGTYMREAKNGRRSVELLVEALDKMLAHDKKIRLSIEPKPNEPMDHAYLPTIGHALAIAQLTRDPKRVGCLIESAHAILAGLDPADEIDFAMAFGKLWSLHLNDQNGLKFDQDKPFASSNLRVAFNQVRALERNGYGKKGEYVCFDVHPFRPTKVEHWLAHLDNSRRTFLRLLDKARSFKEDKAKALIADRNYAALDQMVLEHLMGK
jgi:xylose isomerase